MPLVKNSKIHFIGICGVGMSALAIALHKQGHRVTGSDKGFYPPVSTKLKEADVSYYPGWHVDKMIANGVPDLVVVGNVAGSENPEWLHVQKNQIPHLSYPELIEQEMIRSNSIVCAGTYGKTTTSALMAWILEYAKMHPSYMFGGVAVSDFDSAALDDSDWNVLEGDEYKTGRDDSRAKFFHYRPSHLLLTSVVWDHADLYPTPTDYNQAFTELVQELPAGGLLVVSEKVDQEISSPCPAQVITYGSQTNNTYQYHQVEATAAGVHFQIKHSDQTYSVFSPILGDYMADNATGCFALATEIGIDPETTINAIASFSGIKRRLEKRLTNKITVFDDIAHSPTKAQAVLKSLRQLYTGKITAVFEPNSGNRLPQVSAQYHNAFADADTVVIPRLTKIKKNANEKEIPMEGEDLKNLIADSHRDVHFFEEDNDLVSFLTDTTKAGDVIVFLGSHGFRGMIEEVVEILQK